MWEGVGLNRFRRQKVWEQIRNWRGIIGRRKGITYRNQPRVRSKGWIKWEGTDSSRPIRKKVCVRDSLIRHVTAVGKCKGKWGVYDDLPKVVATDWIRAESFQGKLGEWEKNLEVWRFRDWTSRKGPKTLKDRKKEKSQTQKEGRHFVEMKGRR